jgi:hypothetical protein
LKTDALTDTLFQDLTVALILSSQSKDEALHGSTKMLRLGAQHRSHHERSFVSQ